MTSHSRLMLSVAAMCFGLALAPAAFAQTMAPPANTMTKPDTMAKPDTMGKTDTMAKPADKTDAMKKEEDKKKDAMSGGMTK